MTQKKPIAEHVTAGTFRKGRHAGPSMPVEPPPMPPDMSPAAQACWNTVVEECRFAGVLARVDGKAMRLLAESWALYLDAQDSIREHGIVISEPTAHGGNRVKANPACAIRSKAWKEVQTILAKFGLTPADRTGLKAGANVGESNKRDDVRSILRIGG
jgi:P27 family predicted phage terminase small subunit